MNYILLLPFIYIFFCSSQGRAPLIFNVDLKNMKDMGFFFRRPRNGPGFWEGTLEFSIRTLSARKSGHPRGDPDRADLQPVWWLGGWVGFLFVEDSDFSYRKLTS